MKTVRFHQGDVQGCTVSKLPEGAVKTANRPLALGDKNGHAHVVTGDAERYESKGRVFFWVKTFALLQHINMEIMKDRALWNTTQELPVADHKSIPLKAGVYEFYIQNEYNPYKKIFEKVID
jgi:hypothetical protein